MNAKTTIRPTTLEGVKRLAKGIKTKTGVSHARALDAASAAAGFNNLKDAQRRLTAVGAAEAATWTIYVSARWRDRAARSAGEEVLALTFSAPLADQIKGAELNASRHLAGFRMAAGDHLADTLLSPDSEAARERVCGAARTLAFIEATGLRPSKAARRGYPGGDFDNALPGRDHDSIWRDPLTKTFVFVDEPYAAAVESQSEARRLWSARYGWALKKSRWAGMYNPDGGCALYLAAEAGAAFDVEQAIAALDALPPPQLASGWTGESRTASDHFVSPLRLVAVTMAPERAHGPNVARGPTRTVAYRSPLMRAPRRRPAVRMTIESHAEIGRLLKAAIALGQGRAGVVNRLGAVRNDLDDWVQGEYSHAELPSERIFVLYYRVRPSAEKDLGPRARKAQITAAIDQASALLKAGYADCAPVRSLLKQLEMAKASAAAWRL